MDEAEITDAVVVSDRGWWTASIAAAVGVGLLVATTVADQRRNYAWVGVTLIVILFLATWFGGWLPYPVRVAGVVGAGFAAVVSLGGLAYLVPIPGLIGLGVAWLTAVPTERPPPAAVVLGASALVVGLGLVAATPADRAGLLFAGVEDEANDAVAAVIELPGATSFTVVGLDEVCIGLEARASDAEIDAIVAAVAAAGGELVADESC